MFYLSVKLPNYPTLREKWTFSPPLFNFFYKDVSFGKLWKFFKNIFYRKKLRHFTEKIKTCYRTQQQKLLPPLEFFSEKIVTPFIFFWEKLLPLSKFCMKNLLPTWIFFSEKLWPHLEIFYGKIVTHLIFFSPRKMLPLSENFLTFLVT